MTKKKKTAMTPEEQQLAGQRKGRRLARERLAAEKRAEKERDARITSLMGDARVVDK